MRISISAFLLVFALTLNAQHSLVLVDDLVKDKYDFPVIDYVDNHYFVLAEKSHIELLQTRGIQFKILDSDVTDKEYYLVYPFIETPVKTASYSVEVMKKYGTVLAGFEKVILMESDPDQLHSITEYRVELDYLELEPMNLNTSNNTIISPEVPYEKKTTRYNPILKDMIDRVNPDSVEALLKKLCEFHTRHVKSTCSKDEVIPWIKEIYRTYGCDSIISLSMGNEYSDEVIGVRRGKKDPSIKKFVLLGGHLDNIILNADPDVRHEGANDNATGQVAVLEACRVHQHYEFDYTILYCTHNGEELGLLGSRQVCRLLTGEQAQVIGGAFSFDMFGMKRSSGEISQAGSWGPNSLKINFSVSTATTGAQEFVDKMKELQDLYSITQPEAITTTTTTSIASDPANYWRNGFTCIGHNFAISGTVWPHTASDVITNDYDKEYHAELTKLGIITSAEYAGVHPTKINAVKNVSLHSLFKCTQTGKHMLFTFNDKQTLQAGKLHIFDLHGKLIRGFTIDKSMTRILWDRKNNNGTPLASHSVILVRYSSPSRTSTLKIIM